MVRALVALTKPRIIELLLVTTVPAMLLAQRGVPSIRLVLVTLVGGTLAAGSANTINCYIDRDIDALMRRTSRRPLARAAPADHRAAAGFTVRTTSATCTPSSARITGARPSGLPAPWACSPLRHGPREPHRPHRRQPHVARAFSAAAVPMCSRRKSPARVRRRFSGRSPAT